MRTVDIGLLHCGQVGSSMRRARSDADAVCDADTVWGICRSSLLQAGAIGVYGPQPMMPAACVVKAIRRINVR
jgi:hypothetical protein